MSGTATTTGLDRTVRHHLILAPAVLILVTRSSHGRGNGLMSLASPDTCSVHDWHSHCHGLVADYLCDLLLKLLYNVRSYKALAAFALSPGAKRSKQALSPLPDRRVQ